MASVRSRRRTIRPPGPVDLGLTLGPVVRGHTDPTARLAGGELWRATRTPDGPATERVRAESGAIRVTAWGPGAGWLCEHASELVGGADDPSAFTPRHDVLRELHRRHPGLRLGRTGAVVEALVPSVLEQKIAGKEARLNFRALVRAHGEPAPGPGGLFLPPDPATLAALPSWAYHPLGIERRRADVIRRACGSARRIEEAAALPFPEASRRLRTFPGVGVWTAAEVARVALGDPDAVSAGDYHLKHQVAWVLAGEPRGTDERMLELLEPYRGQRGRAVRLIELSGLGPPRRGPRRPLRNIARI